MSLVAFLCPEHGFVAEAPEGATVLCRTGPYRPGDVPRCGKVCRSEGQQTPQQASAARRAKASRARRKGRSLTRAFA